MNDVSIVTKTWLLMGLLVMGLAGLVGVAKWSGQAVDQANVELTTRVLPFQRNAMELHLGVMQLQLSLKDASTMRGQDALDAGLTKADASYTTASKQIDAMLAVDPEHAQEYQEFHTKLDSFYLTGKTMAQTFLEQGADTGNAGMLAFDEAADKLLREVGELWERAAREEKEMIASQLEIVHAGSNKVLFTSLLTGVVMLAGLMLLNRTVKPLADLTTTALRIAGNDLSGKVSRLDRADEVGRLSAAVSSMQDKLVQRVQEIAAVTEQVRHAVATLNTVSDQASSGVEQQRSETQQVATAMNEMTATVHEVARNTAAAAEAARHADDEVGGGSKVVKQTMASINKLADEVRKGAEVISRLEQDSNNIGAVLDVIKAIAEQTNLLALNAAIEAARAGEQGRGFAVVADEVRTLAQRTQESTREIQQMIEKLQQGAQEAVRVMHEGRSQAEASVSQAGQAGQSLDTIRSAVSTIHDMTAQIASAAEEQSAVAEEINRNIVNISHVVDQTASGMQETAGASDELTRLAEQLQAVVTRFKLPA